MVLVDTHALIWAVTDPGRLGPQCMERLRTHPVGYSSICIAELRLKQLKGKLDLPADFTTRLLAFGFVSVPLTDADADELITFADLDGDPFDRMLVAQAAARGHDFVTADRRLLALDHDWIVDATA